ncbi:hypothetical protein BOVA514_3049 [Bacteroides ovatus]|nr:hypothetical protein BOVA514_3049 [Bacteroides ovatus]
MIYDLMTENTFCAICKDNAQRQHTIHEDISIVNRKLSNRKSH